ncbi:MAG: hypothetical protein EOR60_09575 [Mesorhizobium sp.]|nr:MAG: hypothetical protein EOR60_09575 [Mesorhizobium sp.]
MIPFPLTRRIGKIRDVALKMLAKSTDRHSVYYREQVSAGLIGHLERLGIPESRRDEQIRQFWAAVHAEILRLNLPGRTAWR